MANFQLEVLVAVLACAVAALAAVLVYREVRQMQDRITMLAKAAMDVHRRLDATDAALQKGVSLLTGKIDQQAGSLDTAWRSLAGIDRRLGEMQGDVAMASPFEAANTQTRPRGAAFYASSPAAEKAPGLISVPRNTVTRTATTGDEDAQRKRKIRSVEEFFARVDAKRVACGKAPVMQPQAPALRPAPAVSPAPANGSPGLAASGIGAVRDLFWKSVNG
jgi:hypothetical protein